MSDWLTRDGRIPKNKWLVMPYGQWLVTSRHNFKSAAMDKALSRTFKTGRAFEVCEITVKPNGMVHLRTVFDTRRYAAQLA